MLHPPLTLTQTVGDLANHPAFRGFGELLLPWDNNARYYATSLSKVGSLMPYHGQVQPTVVLSAVNQLIKGVNSGQTIFYSFYSPQQKQQDTSKEQTGLFFFR
ncbi:MAG: hypothetical protein EON92_20295 [Burkholderiales bacterium]|nr:MAG: hypothetical protein EON92_20295 [Burkholderiales bacterium]